MMTAPVPVATTVKAVPRIQDTATAQNSVPALDTVMVQVSAAAPAISLVTIAAMGIVMVAGRVAAMLTVMAITMPVTDNKQKAYATSK
jgi:hypothetical protein